MKFFNPLSGKALYFVLPLLAISTLLSSCIKDNSPTLVTTPYALVLFVQASPDLPPVDFFFDNNLINSSPLNFSNGINYLSVYATTKTANIYNHSNNTKILTDSLHLTANNAYTLFLINKPATPQILSVNDTLNVPQSGSANIRFINLSPDAPAVDFAVNGGAVISGNKMFKSYSSFNPLTGNQSYSFVVRQAGTNTILATLNNVAINSGFTYTFWLGGLVAGTTANDKLSINIINNVSLY